MPHGPIAELIRTRSVVEGRLAEEDVVVCFAADEAELLETRPDLQARQRIATEHMHPAVVLFLPAADAPRLGLWDGPAVAFPLSAVYRYMDRP